MRGEIEEMTDFDGAVAHPRPNREERFHYHRQVAPMLWAFAALGLIELSVVHLLLSHWSRAAAYALDVLSGGALLTLLALLFSLRSRPVVLGAGGLHIRLGFLIDAPLPLDEVAFAQSGYAPADYMPGSLLK